VEEGADPAGAELLGQCLPGVAEHPRRLGQELLAAGVAGDADPLEGQDLLHHLPATVDGPQDVVVGGAHLVEEDLVQVVRPHHRADRSDLDAGTVHGHQEDGEALLLALLPRGPGQQEAPLGHGGVGGPDLLAGDPPAGAVSHRGRPEGGQVRAGVGLAEALAPDDLAGGDGGEVLVTLRSVPWRMMVGPTQFTPMYWAPRGSWWAHISSRTAVWAHGEASWPP
jgi:hypothetical protein